MTEHFVIRSDALNADAIGTEVLTMQEENKLRRDCYFFSEVQDMGGRIHTCKIRKCLGCCPCDRCDLFFSVKDAENAIYAIFEKQTGGADNAAD
jgi:hypothetical protein